MRQQTRLTLGCMAALLGLIIGGCRSESASQRTAALPLPRDVPMGFHVEYYSSIDDYRAELEQLKASYPGKFDFHTDRKCYGGKYPLYWVTVGDTTKPAIMIVGVLHAKNEKAGAHVIMRFLERVLGPEDVQSEFNSALLENFCIVSVPIANVWGYFASPDGKHYNAHAAPVPNIEDADWHDMSNYDRYFGVNLNRNFDCHWEAYPSVPWSVKQYWNGTDYGEVNYFMMPFYIDESGNEVFDPENLHPNHILKPDPEVYDYKGGAPFSEPETQLIRDLFSKYHVVGFMDVHSMNPWVQRNASYISHNVDRDNMMHIVDEAIKRVNRRNSALGAQLPKTRHTVIEEYDGGAPTAVNWAQNTMGVKTFAWETGTDFPEKLWTDAYMEMFYQAIYWMRSELPVRSEVPDQHQGS